MRKFQTVLCLNRAVLLDFMDVTSEQALEFAVSIMQRDGSGDHLSLVCGLASSLRVRHQSARGAAAVVVCLLLFSSEEKIFLLTEILI